MKKSYFIPVVIALMLALVSLSVSTVYAGSPPPLGGVEKFKYKIGDKGPGGGFIFFVDYYDQYPDFTYLEAAPNDIAPVIWCDLTTTSIHEVEGWSAKGVGKGQANTNAMIAAGCTSGAANSADQYVTATKSDWFLPSLGEAKLMNDNLLEAGVGDFVNFYYWSSSEYDGSLAWSQNVSNDYQVNGIKNFAEPVRAIRAF